MKKEFSVCLTHDVDRVKKTFQFVTHFLRSASRVDLRAMVYQMRSVFMTSHYWCFERIMEIERKKGLRSTFFFLNETYPVSVFKPSSWRLGLGYYNMLDPGVKRVIRTLNEQGWEIGLHGSYLSYKDPELLRMEKNDLEGIVGHPVLGIRQHYLNLDENTWLHQAEAGLLYDASYGYTRDLGFKESRFHPFKPISNRHFYVVPLALMDACLMRKKNPLQKALNIIKLAEEKCACLVLCWHQRVFNEKEFPGYMDMYLRIIEECMSRKAKFSTIGEYIQRMS